MTGVYRTPAPRPPEPPAPPVRYTLRRAGVLLTILAVEMWLAGLLASPSILYVFPDLRGHVGYILTWVALYCTISMAAVCIIGASDLHWRDVLKPEVRQ